MLPRIQLIFILLLVTSCATMSPVTEPAFALSNKAFKQADFITHTGSGTYQNYLTLNLSYPAFADLKNQVEKQLGFAIKGRGEAHITVISPPEFDKVLKAHITIEDINRLAQAKKLQEISWRPLCVGKGNALINGHREYTYYVVVEAPELTTLRKEIQNIYVAKGGKDSDFNPLIFYPHITLGYSSRDLFYEDGVAKDLRSCWGNLKLVDEPQDNDSDNHSIER